jgi:aryl-alcohol dehydrogenase-like predicted oxidoreductase
MRYNLLGGTGLFVSELCLGAMSFGATTGRYAAGVGGTQEDANTLVRHAFEAGVNLFDTANIYTDGQSEEILGRALQQLGIGRHEVVLATKATHAAGPGPNDQGASRYHLVQQVQRSLKRLGNDHIDLFQLQGWDAATPVEETLRALDDLVRQGLVRYFGISNWAA